MGAAQRLCFLFQGLLGLDVAGGTQLLAKPFSCDLRVAVELHVDDALVKACLFACLEERKALAGLVVAPNEHGGAVIQIQEALPVDPEACTHICS